MLQIDRPIHWARLFAALGAVVQTLTGDEGGWTIGSRQVLEDREWSPSRAFTQVLSRPAARLEIEVASSTTGNPRDGWGYTFRVHLAVHTSIGEVSLMGSAYDGRMMDSGVMPPHSLSLRGPIDGACFDRVRAALAEALGREVSPGGCNAWAHNIEAIKLEDPDRARRWLAESLSMRHSTGERSLKRLLDLSDELRGADPQILRRRLRSTPADSSLRGDKSGGPRRWRQFGWGVSGGCRRLDLGLLKSSCVQMAKECCFWFTSWRFRNGF